MLWYKPVIIRLFFGGPQRRLAQPAGGCPLVRDLDGYGVYGVVGVASKVPGGMEVMLPENVGLDGSGE